MMAQLLLSALFLGFTMLAVMVIVTSLMRAIPRLRALRAEMAAGDPMAEMRWLVTTVEVSRIPSAAVSVLPIRRKVASPHQQTWLAAA